MAKPLKDQVWEINASVAALSLLVDHLLLWHFQTRKHPQRTAEGFSRQVQEELAQMTMPGFDPAVSDHAVGMVQDDLHRHMRRVLAWLEDAT